MKPWYQSVHLWGQVNLTEDDPEKCDLAVWEGLLGENTGGRCDH